MGWGSSKIAYDVIIQQIQDFELKLIDFEEKIKWVIKWMFSGIFKLKEGR